MNMSHCTGCGQALDFDSRFCAACGQAVTPGTTAPTAVTPPPPAPPAYEQTMSAPPIVPPPALQVQPTYTPPVQQPGASYGSSPYSSDQPKKGMSKGLLTGLSLGAAAIVVVGLGAFLLGGKDTRLIDAHENCKDEDSIWSILYATVSDDGTSMYMDGRGEEGLGVNVSYQACVLRELEVPSTVLSRIDNTSALMGVQTASWKGIEASWTYHPNRGLDISLELE